MLSVRNLTKTYGDAKAVDDVSLDVPAGQIVALIGPSGCGKSTLLRLMLKLLEPTAGEVGFDFDKENNPRRVRQKCGYVIQDGGLFPHLTARGNVTLLARNIDAPDRWDAARIEGRLEELCQLTSFDPAMLDRYPTELSGGQRQRVALMRALMLDPRVLFLDEPLGALDPLVRADLQRDLRAIFRKLGKTVVMVTHDMAEATYFADRIVLMKDGQIVQQGAAADLRESPASPFVTDFLTAQAQLHGEEVAA